MARLTGRDFNRDYSRMAEVEKTAYLHNLAAPDVIKRVKRLPAVLRENIHLPIMPTYMNDLHLMTQTKSDR